MIGLDQGGGIRHAVTEIPIPAALDPWIEQIALVAWPAGLAGCSWLVVPDPSGHVLVHRLANGDTRAMVVGARASAAQFELGARLWTIAVRLRPGALPALLGDDASALTDRAVTLSSLGIADPRVSEAEDARACAATLIEALGRVCAGRRVPDWRVRGLVSMTSDGARSTFGGSATAQLRVPRAARALGVGERTLREVVRRETGLSPGLLIRIRRALSAAEEIVATDDGLSRIAHRTGYSDHAHLTHEFGRLLREPPGRFRRRRWTVAEFDKRGGGRT